MELQKAGEFEADPIDQAIMSACDVIVDQGEAHSREVDAKLRNSNDGSEQSLRNNHTSHNGNYFPISVTTENSGNLGLFFETTSSGVTGTTKELTFTNDVENAELEQPFSAGDSGIEMAKTGISLAKLLSRKKTGPTAVVQQSPKNAEERHSKEVSRISDDLGERSSQKDPQNTAYKHEPPVRPTLRLATSMCTLLLLCCLSAFLVWCSSLSLISQYVQVLVPPPKYEKAINQVLWAYGLAIGEKDDYEDCIEDSFADCNRELSQFIDKEINRTLIAAQSLRQYVEQTDNISSSCQQASTNIITTIKEWLQSNSTILQYKIWSSNRTGGDSFSDNLNGSCSPKDKEVVRGLLSDYSEYSRSAASSVDLFSDSLSGTLRQTIDSIQRRSAYDTRYAAVVAENVLQLEKLSSSLKTDIDGQVLQQIKASLNRIGQDLYECSHGMSDCGTQQVVEALVTAQQQAEDLYQASRRLFERNKSLAVSYIKTVQSTLSIIYTSLKPIANIFDSFGISVSLLDKIQNLANGVVSLEDFNVPFPTNPLPGATVQPLLDYLQSTKQALTNVQTKASANLQNWESTAASRLQTVRESILPPYRPPPLDMNAFGVQLSQKLSILKDSVVSVLGDAQLSFKYISNATLLTSSPNITQVGEILSETIERLAPTSVEEISLTKFNSDLNISWVLLQIEKIPLFTMQIDGWYRVFTIAREVARFLNRGHNTDLSELHLSPDVINTSGAFLLTALAKGTATMMARILTSRFLWLAVTLGLSSLILYFGIVLYIKLYTEYAIGCKEKSGTTFIHENFYALAYNYAAFQGNFDKAKAAALYEQRKQQTCAEQAHYWYAEAKELNEIYNNALLRYVSTQEQLSSIAKCIDSEKMVTDVMLAKIDSSDNRSQSFNVYAWKRENFSAQFTLPVFQFYAMAKEIKICTANATQRFGKLRSLEDFRSSIFSCTNVPRCIDRCSGPRQYILYHSVRRASCAAESEFHIFIFRIIIVLVVFLGFNMCRIWFMRALSTYLAVKNRASLSIRFSDCCDHQGNRLASKEQMRKAVNGYIRTLRVKGHALSVGAGLACIGSLSLGVYLSVTFVAQLRD